MGARADFFIIICKSEVDKKDTTHMQGAAPILSLAPPARAGVGRGRKRGRGADAARRFNVFPSLSPISHTSSTAFLSPPSLSYPPFPPTRHSLFPPQTKTMQALARTPALTRPASVRRQAPATTRRFAPALPRPG